MQVMQDMSVLEVTPQVAGCMSNFWFVTHRDIRPSSLALPAAIRSSIFETVNCLLLDKARNADRYANHGAYTRTYIRYARLENVYSD